jgi:hypothetical protein
MAEKNLETMLNGLEDKVGKPFGIDPKKGYETKYFIDNADDLFKLLDNYKKFNEDSKNTDALNDLTKICGKYVKGSAVESIVRDPELAVSYANKILNNGVDSMAHYVETNRENVLDELSEKGLYSIFINATLFKNESDKNHERIRKLRDKYVEITNAKDEKEIEKTLEGDMKEYLDSVKNKNPILYEFVAENLSRVKPHLLNGLVTRIDKEFKSTFRNEKGELEKKEIKEYLEKNYDIAKNFISTIEDDKRRRKAWDKNLQGQYLMIAQALYAAEEEKRKKEEDEKDSVKKEAKKLGIKV